MAIFTGAGVAIVTPMNQDGLVNYDKLGEIIVVGTDGAAEALQSVEAGELSATVAQDSAGIGAVSLEQMVNAVKSGAEINPDNVPETIPVDSYIVSKK